MSSIRISDEYRALNREMHETHPNYGTSSKWADWVSHLDDILDYGCGKGMLAEALGRQIAEYDPCVPGKDSEPDPHDYIVCTDVLEHIEPEYLDDVLSHIASKMRHSGFFVIATRPARKLLPNGRNAHLIVQDWNWWRERIKHHFRIDHVIDRPTRDGEVAVWVSKCE